MVLLSDQRLATSCRAQSLGELGAPPFEFRDEFAHPSVPRAGQPDRGPERRHHDPAQVFVLLGRVLRPFGAAHEPPPRLVPLVAGQTHGRAEERRRHRVLDESFPQVVHDDRRGVRQPVQHAEDRGVDVVGAVHPDGRVLPGQVEQVVAFVERAPEGTGDRGDHLLRRLRAALLFEPRVVVDGHAGEGRHLFTTEARGAPPSAGPDPDVLRAEQLPSAAEEVGEGCTVHAPSLLRPSRRSQGAPVPR